MFVEENSTSVSLGTPQKVPDPQNYILFSFSRTVFGMQVSSLRNKWVPGDSWIADVDIEKRSVVLR